MLTPRIDPLKSLKPPRRPDLSAADLALVPPRTHWFWRPAPWAGQPVEAITAADNGRRIAPGLSLHHDATKGSPSLKPLKSGGIALQTKTFDGSFLSLAIGMDLRDATQVARSDLIRLQTRITASAPVEVYARLNLASGPDKQEIAYSLAADGSDQIVEWDLSFTHWDQRRATNIWLDLIFSAPKKHKIEIAELFLLRHPRAEF